MYFRLRKGLRSAFARVWIQRRSSFYVLQAPNKEKMTQGSRYSHDFAHAAARLLPSGVVVVEFWGLLTRDTLDLLKRHISDNFTAQARGVVADYRRAALAITPDDARDMMFGRAVTNWPDLPSAVVAGQALLRTFGTLAVDAALQGYYRRVFKAQGAAIAWVEALVTERPENHRHPTLDQDRQT